MNPTVRGTAFKYGDNVDTDVIIPARYLNIADPQELATHAMEDIDPSFVRNVKPGDIVVATKNFGCGSSREHAPRVLKDNGVTCVIASSFARIFYRNAINIGLPILECEQPQKRYAAATKSPWTSPREPSLTKLRAKRSRHCPFPNSSSKSSITKGS